MQQEGSVTKNEKDILLFENTEVGEKLKLTKKKGNVHILGNDQAHCCGNSTLNFILLGFVFHL